MSGFHLSSRSSRAWTSAVLLLALLPTLSFLGHWDEIFFGAGATTSVMSFAPASIYDPIPVQTDQARHAQHCHTNLGACTEQPMPAGVGLLITRELLLGPPPLPLPVRLADAQALPLAPAINPLLPPPRAI